MEVAVRSGPIFAPRSPVDMATDAVLLPEIGHAGHFLGRKLHPVGRRGVIDRHLARGLGVVITAAAVSPVHPMAASTTKANATVRRVTLTICPRSINGTRISASTASAGSTTLPTISSGPVNSFSVWKRNRKYHSGRGM